MKPMLAVNCVPENVNFPVYASPKLDGIRGLIIDGVLKSRSLKPIPNKHTTALFSRPELSGYDGELIVGDPTAKDVFRQTGSATSRENFKPDVTFYVFDNFNAPGTFAQRIATLKKHPGVVILPQLLVRNIAELLKVETELLSAGYEGLILRSPNGRYKFGRSTENEGGMLKVKRFSDSEAVILDVEEEMENTNAKVTNELGRSQRSSHQAGKIGKGRAGALVVRDDSTGQTFSIGGGLNADDREFFWANRKSVVGKIVKYKSFLIGVKDAPRFPIYLGGRESWDMS